LPEKDAEDLPCWAGEEAESLDTSSPTGKDDVHQAHFGDLVNGQIVNAQMCLGIVAIVLAEEGSLQLMEYD
jgi:hypothetical protein